MINFDNIENSLRHEIADDNGDGSCDLTNTALLELTTLLRQAEKDAARYRWLNEQNKSVMSKVMVCNGWIDDSEDDVEYISDLSSFIDEAMQCGK